MALVDSGLKNLMQGVSQQGRPDRREGQCVLQQNMVADVVRGLSRRPHSLHIAALMGNGTNYSWQRFVTEQGTYLVALATGACKVFDMFTGVEQTVNATGLSYITGTDTTVTALKDTLYIADRTVTTAMSVDTVGRTPAALVQILGGQFDRKYEVVVGDPNNPALEIAFSWTSGATNTDLSTDVIATNLETAANALTAFTADYQITRKKDVLLIEWAGASAGSTDRIEITESDGAAGALIVTVSERIDTVELLPRLAPADTIIKVTGLASAEEDDSFFRFDQEKPGFGNDGLWVETNDPDDVYKFDLTTMPHTLVQETDGSFTFGQGAWENRRVGDASTNPEPSFLDGVIEDLGSFQGRLVALTKDTVVMTRTDKYLDFWKQSAVQLNLDDPIDIEGTSKRSATMRYLVPHNRDLVIFADTAEFIIFGRNALTTENASIVLTTEFEVDLTARPAPSGKNVFFPTQHGGYTGIREFYAEGSADANDSRPITSHVDTYLEGRAMILASSSNYDMLIVQTDTSTKDLYVYEFLWEDESKVQSAWSTWVMPDDVVFVEFIESTVYMITVKDADYQLVTVPMAVTKDNGVNYQAALDNKLMLNTHTSRAYTLPFTATNVEGVQGDGCPHPGLHAEIESIVGNIVTTVDDFGSGEVWFGETMISIYEPTMPMIKDEKDVRIGTGDLIVDNFLITYKDTGEFKTTVSSAFYDDVNDYYSGFVLGDPSFLLGTQPITSGIFEVYFGDDPELAQLRIHTDDHLPLTIQDIEWEGQWKKKGRRI